MTLKFAHMVGGAVVLAAVVAVAHALVVDDTDNYPIKEQETPMSTYDNVPSDYDPSVEEPVIEDGKPESYEDFARDADLGRHPDDQPVPGGGSITVTMGQTVGTVREWHAELGWGVLDSPDTPGGCWVYWSTIDGTGFRALTAGATVEFGWELAQQDGYSFRATRVHPLDE